MATSKQWRPLGALALSFTLLVGCGSAESGKARVILFAIDGASWDVIEPMLEAGRLPTFRRLVDEGVVGSLSTITEPQRYLSGALWTTVATGKSPAEHGIPGNRMEDGSLPTSDRRRVPALWNIASDAGLRVGVVGYFVTWPAEPVNGVVISDRTTGKNPRSTFPSTALEDLGFGEFWVWRPGGRRGREELRRFIDFDFRRNVARRGAGTPSDFRHFLVNERLHWVYPRDATFAKIGLEVWNVEAPEFLAVYLRGADFVSHAFWMFHDPDHGAYPEEALRFLTPELVRSFGALIGDYYAWVDEILGLYLAAADDRTVVLVLSDHGFGPRQDPAKDDWFITGTHRDEGLLAAWGRGVRRGERFDGVTLYDIAPTVLHELGLPVARDMPGRVLEDLFEDRFARDIRFVEAYTHDAEAGAGMSEPVKAVDDEAERRRLRALGYID